MRTRDPNKRGGIALIIVIILVVIVSIAVFGVVKFIFESSRLTVMKANGVQAYYAAQTGLSVAMRSVTTRTFQDTRNRRVSPSLPYYYSYGRGLDYLLVAPSQAELINYNTLQNIGIYNYNRRYNIRITGLIVEWRTPSPVQLINLRLGNVWQRNFTPKNSGQEITLNPPLSIARWGGGGAGTKNQFVFNGVPPQPVYVTFVGTLTGSAEDRRKVLILDENYRTGNDELRITATGWIGPAQNALKRTIMTRFDPYTRAILSLEDTAKHI